MQRRVYPPAKRIHGSSTRPPARSEARGGGDDDERVATEHAANENVSRLLVRQHQEGGRRRRSERESHSNVRRSRPAGAGRRQATRNLREHVSHGADEGVSLQQSEIDYCRSDDARARETALRADCLSSIDEDALGDDQESREGSRFGSISTRLRRSHRRAEGSGRSSGEPVRVESRVGLLFGVQLQKQFSIRNWGRLRYLYGMRRRKKKKGYSRLVHFFLSLSLWGLALVVPFF